MSDFAALRDVANWSRDERACGCVFWTFQHPDYDDGGGANGGGVNAAFEVSLLVEEVERLRIAIGRHRDATRSQFNLPTPHEHDAELWAALGDEQ